MQKETHMPEKKFRAGAISATIWENQGKINGNPPTTFNCVSIERTYKDKQGSWQSTRSMRLNDLPKAMVVLNKAYEYLVTKEVNIPLSKGTQTKILNK